MAGKTKRGTSNAESEAHRSLDAYDKLIAKGYKHKEILKMSPSKRKAALAR